MLKYCAFLLNPGAFFGDLIMCVPGQKGGYEDILTSYYLMKSGFYQWVRLLLLLHHVLTTLPAYLWEILEGKRLNKLLHKGVKMDNMAKFMNYYLGNDLGLFPPVDVFMSEQSCDFTFFGPSGDFNHVSGTCIQNYMFLYEKLYTTLYILFIVLAIISSFQIILHTMLIFSLSMRARWVKWSLDVNCSNLEIQKIVGYSLLIMFANMVNHKQVSRLIKRIVTLRKDKDDDVDVIKYKY